MKLFGPVHISLLAVVIGLAIAFPLLCRRNVISRRAVRLALGWLIAVNEVVWWCFRYSHEGVRTANLPLQLCDLTVWLSVLGCLTLAPTIVEFAYFAGIAGAGMAMITPDLWTPWTSYPAAYFFIAHGGIVIASALLAFGGYAPFRPGAISRSFALLLGYAALVGTVNAILGSNYMFLCRKPGSASPLDQMGPWPWYLVGGAAAGLGLFWLLWLPVRPGKKR